MAVGPFVDTLKGMRIGGRYVVDRVLGSGGMGVVAIARYPELQQKVAIKFLRPEHASNALLAARFVREARVAARVKSEHFVRVFDIGKLPTGVPYLVMELLSGRDLGDELTAVGSIPAPLAVDYVLQAAVGIAEIHALGIVHRDLKPSNLFISEVAGKRMIKVLDFGISKEQTGPNGTPLTATEQLLGTPQYMSPEQVRASKDVDARSDIWSLGVILYEILTGERPFSSEDNGAGEIFAKVLFTEPSSIRHLKPDLSEALDAVVMKCLARDRDARFKDVGELADALRPFAGGTSSLRIDAVHQALNATPSLLPPPDEEPPPASQLSTSVSDASKDALAETSLADAARSDEAASAAKASPVTAMTSSSSSKVRPRTVSSRQRYVGVGVAAALLVGGGSFVLSSRSAPSPQPQPQPQSLPTIVNAAPAVTPPVTATPATSAAIAEPTPEPPSATASSRPLPSADQAAASAAMPVRPTKPAAAPHPIAPPKGPASPASAKPSAGDLILDRK